MGDDVRAFAEAIGKKVAVYCAFHGKHEKELEGVLLEYDADWMVLRIGGHLVMIRVREIRTICILDEDEEPERC